MLIAVITVSDRASKGIYKDLSGPAIQEILLSSNKEIEIETSLVPDNIKKIISAFKKHKKAAWIISTGGTGTSARDLTPEATKKYCDRELSGLSEYLRLKSLEETEYAVFSRAYAGMRGRQYIVNLPGSEKAARFCAALLLKFLDHGLSMAKGEDHPQ